LITKETDIIKLQSYNNPYKWLFSSLYKYIYGKSSKLLTKVIIILQTVLGSTNPSTKLYMFCAFFWVIPRLLNFTRQRFGTPGPFHLHIYPPMKMEQTECSETLAYKIQRPGNYPEECIQHSELGESLKSRKIIHIRYNSSNYESQ